MRGYDQQFACIPLTMMKVDDDYAENYQERDQMQEMWRRY